MKTSTVIITIAVVAAAGLFAAKKMFKDDKAPEPKPGEGSGVAPQTTTTPAKTEKNIQPFAMTQSQYEKNAGIATTAFTGINYTSPGQGVNFGAGRVSLDLASIPKS